MENRSVLAPSVDPSSGWRAAVFPAILALFVLITRILFRGPMYFGDGPAELASIQHKTYIIQPPGYWLFIRIAGLFSDPVLAMTVMNILFSAAGVIVFYYAACFFATRLNAFLAALAYSTIFYIWFSGEIHSTYASQILFPVATYYLLLCYERDRAKWMFCLAALLFAVGAGLRPTDGMFMIPLIVYFAVFRMSRRNAVAFLVLCVLFCLGWLIPTWLAFKTNGPSGVHSAEIYVSEVTTIQSIRRGIHLSTIANFVRYAIPLLVGLWPILGVSVLNAVRNRRDWRVAALLVWLIPGSLFFVLILISNAPYLDCITAAFLLLAVSAPRRMVVTAVWNAIVFLALGPVPSQNIAVNVMNSFVLRCTRGGIAQRYNATLSQMQGFGKFE